MFCPRCGKEIEITEDFRFCPGCGLEFSWQPVETNRDYTQNHMSQEQHEVLKKVGEEIDRERIVRERSAKIGCFILVAPIILILIMVIWFLISFLSFL